LLLLDRTAALPSTERAVEDTPLEEPLERVVLLERAELLAPLERVLEVLLLELLTPLERVLLLLERVALPLRRLLSCWLLLTPVERVAEEPLVLLERLTEELPLERELELLLEPLLLRRLSCWTALLLEERVLVDPLERTVELLPEELLLDRELELLPEERELLLCWVVLPPLERRVWAPISGAMSMARASIMEAANVINLLIALKFLS
jgi:hypothetical protein